MLRKMLFPILIGVVGCGILLSLGKWQIDRLAWKAEILSDIDARITSAPVDLPDILDTERDRYLPVKVSGQYRGDTIRILVSQKQIGAGYRLITAFETDTGRQILVDRGVAPADSPTPDTPTDVHALRGNLHWPNEIDGFTPEPDLNANIWFARDVPALADALSTETTLLIVRSSEPGEPGVIPLPVSRVGIPNDHLQYAITWFSLAFIWFGMTLYLLWRIRRRTV